MSVADVAFFSLISYNDDNYPDPDNYDIPAIQKLFKSLRQRLSRNFHEYRKDRTKPIKLKYFIVSEYGEKRNRLHYHLISFLYNCTPELNYVFWKVLLEDTWAKGFCSAFELTNNTISYTCKYIQKDYNMMLYSKGLGADAYLSNPHLDVSYDDLPTYQMNGKNYYIPRSWQDKYYSFNLAFRSVAANAVKLRYQDLPQKLSYKDKIMLDKGFKRDNPRYNKPQEEKYKPTQEEFLTDGLSEF